MRAAYVIPSFGLLLVIILVLSLNDGLTSDGAAAGEGVLTDAAVLATGSLTPPQADPQVEPQIAEPPPGLVCIQNALGGVQAFAGVSSLRIVSDMKPSATSGPRPLAGTREISVVFPDRYKNAHVGHPPSRLSATTGFDGEVLLSMPRIPGSQTAMSSARLRFRREMLMFLPRASAGVTLSQRVASDEGRERLVIDASGPDGFRATLLADSRTCVPIAFQYEGTPFSRTAIVRVDLSGYRTFGGIRFPTVLLVTHGGQPYTEDRVSRVEVNAPDAGQYFASAR